MSVSRLDKFVRERAKTASLAEAHGCRERSIELVVAPGSSDLVRPAVALALRCFTGSVYITVADADSDVLAVAADEAHAYGAEKRLQIGGGDQTVLRLGIGKEIDGVFVDAVGAVACVNKLAARRGTAWPPAAGFAVACGFGKLFARLLGCNDGVLREQFDFSLLTLSAPSPVDDQLMIPADLDLGSVTLIGAGAIGSAFAFVLKGSGWRCQLRIVDPQAYDEPNHETTLLISKDDALACLPKAKTLAQLLGGGAIAAEPLEARVGLGHEVLASACDVLVCAVDNPDTRRILDEANCTVLLNGAVGGDGLDAGLVLWTTHGEGDPTLASLYPEVAETKSNTPPPNEVANDECSRVAYEGVALAAPFMALASASLLAAACAHRVLSTPPAVRYLQFDLLELQSKYTAKLRR